MLFSLSKSWYQNCFTGADGVQFIASHLVQEEGGGAPRASSPIFQNPNGVAGMQRQQSTIQGIPLFSLVISQNDIFSDYLIGHQFECRTLFHALSVNAAAKDPAFVYGGVSSVANSMIGWFFPSSPFLHFFFRLCQSILQLQGVCPPFCKVIMDHLDRNEILDKDVVPQNCAFVTNISWHQISSHVSSLGFLPTNPDQTILWLWTIHNIANRWSSPICLDVRNVDQFPFLGI